MHEADAQASAELVFGERPMIRGLWRPGVGLLAALLGACGGPAGTITSTGSNPAEVRITPVLSTLPVGRTAVVAAKVFDGTGRELSGVSVSWRSLDPTIVSINADGVLTGVAAGHTAITASYQSLSSAAEVIVVASTADTTVAVSGRPTVLALTNGSSVQFEAGVLTPGTVVVLQEVQATVNAGGTPLGKAVQVVFGLAAGIRSEHGMVKADQVVPFSLNLSAVTSLNIANADQLLGFGTGLPGSSTRGAIPMIPRSVVSTPGNAGALTASFQLAVTAGSTPIMQLATLARDCNASNFPDSERLKQLSPAQVTSSGVAPPVLILVHGWQLGATACNAVQGYDYATDLSWGAFLASTFPNSGTGGIRRLQEFEVYGFRYLSTERFPDVGADLARLISARFPGRRVVLLAHSKGGLVSAAAMLSSPTAVSGLVAAGTPWRGTPIAAVMGGGAAGVYSSGCGLVSALSSTLSRVLFGSACDVWSDWIVGTRNMAPSDPDIAGLFTPPNIASLRGRVSAIGSTLTSTLHYGGSGAYFAAYDVGWLALQGEFGVGNDGLVPTSSSRPDGVFDVTLPQIVGFDHSSYLSVTPQGVSPTGQTTVRSELLRWLDRVAPVGLVTLVGPTTLNANQVATYQATMKDASGAALVGRNVLWQSSASTVLAIDAQTGVAQAGNIAGTATITATSEGQTGQIQVSVTPISGPTGSLQGRVYNASTLANLLGATVIVRTTAGVLVGSTATGSGGNWTLGGLQAGEYRIDVSANGFVATSVVSQTLTLPTTIVEPIPLVPSSGVPGGLSGAIRSASTGTAIAGTAITVELRSGMNAILGSPLATQSTVTGAYSFGNVSAGVYTVVARASGYANGSRTGIVVGAGLTVTGQDVTLNPITVGQTARIVLTWGSTPSDLDSHLTGPLQGSTSRFWIYYQNKANCAFVPFACLDVDERFSFGPETITIAQGVPGIYRYYVYDYSDQFEGTTNALGFSGARVQLYINNILARTYFVPPGLGNAWAVFEWDGQVVTAVNQLFSVSGVPQPTLRDRTGGAMVDEFEQLRPGQKPKAP